MKLYFSPAACSLSPHIVLREAGLSFELVLVDTKTHRLPDGRDFFAINPLGYVPTLELPDGSNLTEGVAIVQYIADQAPETHLAPANGTLARYQLQSWLNFISTELHKGFGPLFGAGLSENDKNKAKQSLQNRFKHIDTQLTKTPFLTSEQFTVADAYLFVVANWAAHVQLDLSAFTHLQAYLAKIAARPAVQAALKAEGLLA